MNTHINDPLAALFSKDVGATERIKLAKFLQPFVIIDESSKGFSFHDAFFKLKNEQKIEIILAAAKARALFLNDSENLSSSAIIALGILPEGSVKACLKSLFDSHKIKKGERGSYFIPTYRISELTKSLTTNP